MNIRKTLSKVPVSNMKKMGNKVEEIKDILEDIHNDPESMKQAEEIADNHTQPRPKKEYKDINEIIEDLKSGKLKPEEVIILDESQPQTQDKTIDSNNHADAEVHKASRVNNGYKTVQGADILTKKKKELQKEIDGLRSMLKRDDYWMEHNCLEGRTWESYYNEKVELEAELKGITETEDVLKNDFITFLDNLWESLPAEYVADEVSMKLIAAIVDKSEELKKEVFKK